MVCHELKGGIGTSSRRVRVEDPDFTVGVLGQANHGGRPGLTVAGVPVGQEATVEATEEAILNVLVAAETTTGIDGNTVYALPHERLREVLRKYNRLRE